MISTINLWAQRAVYSSGLAALCLLLVPFVNAQTPPPAEPTAAPVPSMPAPTQASPQSVAATPSASPAASGKATKDKKKKVKEKKEKKPKLTPVTIADGILTVDGFAGKAALNYEIADLQYLYIWAPGIGTTVISNHAFPQAKEQPAAFDGPAVTVTVDGHQLQLTSSKRLLGKKPASAWVLLDTSYAYPSKYPAVGYGSVSAAPFVWPGSRQSLESKSKDNPVAAPPLPVSLLPVQLAVPCPATGVKPVGCIPARTPVAPSTPAPPPTAMPSPQPH